MTDRRRLIVMRHAKAEPFASSDHARPLTDRGLAGAQGRGRRTCASSGSLPTTPWSPPRCAPGRRGTPSSRSAGFTDVEVSFDDAVFTGSPDVVLEALRAAPADAGTVMFVGHNPTAAFLCHFLDDGEGDPAAVSELLHGFPPGAVAAARGAASRGPTSAPRPPASSASTIGQGPEPARPTRVQRGERRLGVVRPSRASAASTSSRLMPSRYMIASR